VQFAVLRLQFCFVFFSHFFNYFNCVASDRMLAYSFIYCLIVIFAFTLLIAACCWQENRFNQLLNAFCSLQSDKIRLYGDGKIYEHIFSAEVGRI